MKTLFGGKRKFLTIPLIAILIVLFFSSAPNTTNKVQDSKKEIDFNKSQTTKPSTQDTSPIPTFKPQTAPANSNLVLARVIRIIDGDTIEVDLGEGNKKTVRYIGIDTPETVDPNRSDQCFGKEASAKNKELVGNGIVGLEKDVSETDRYGRLLRYVYMGDLFINQVLVSEGYAHASSYPPDIKYQDKFRQAEQQARTNSKGLWGNACITPTNKSSQTTNSTETYTCNCSKSCSEISTCAEAQYQLNICGCSARDGDKDGIACDGAPLVCQQ